MTAFARVQKGGFAAEIHSVNRRHLDVRVKAPPFLRPLEPQVRQLLAQRIGRGQVTVTLTASRLGVSLNRHLLTQCKGLAEELAQELDLDRQFCFELAMREGELFEPEEADLDVEGLLGDALVPFLEMKEQEGAAIGTEIALRLKEMETLLGTIEGLTGGSVDRYRKKLVERLDLDDERVVREVALMAERLDVSEEMARFRHHLGQFEQKLATKELVSGKTLEFLVQELGREINTLGSKCADAHISEGVVAIKSELEKIREQLQNIE